MIGPGRRLRRVERERKKNHGRGGEPVLQCPYDGNSACVLSSEWRHLMGLTKADSRERDSRHYIWIVDKGDWLHRIREAL